MRRPSRQLLQTLICRGMVHTEHEALAFLRALKAIDRGQQPLEALGLVNLSPERRARIVQDAIAWRAR